MKRDKVTAVIYCYITTEFHYAKRDSGLSACGGDMLQRSEFAKGCMGKKKKKTLIGIFTAHDTKL